MLTEVKAIEPQLKQVLYGCVEYVQATKAALYLSATADLNAKTYEIVTSYQYNAADRKVLNSSDDLVDRLAVRRNAFYVNGVASDQRLAEILFRQGNDRMLATPLFARGRLVGFIDMRDKAAKKPFDNSDLDAARRIGDQIITLLTDKQLFGLSPNDVAEVALPPPPEPPSPKPSAPPQPALSTNGFSPAAAQAIAAAREIMARRQHQPGGNGRRLLSNQDLETVRLLLPAALAIPGAVLACFTAAEHMQNPQSIVAIATVTEEALEMLQDHLVAWMRQMNRSPGTAMSPEIVYPFGVQVVPISASGITAIRSAWLCQKSIEGLVLTVAFERTPEGEAERILQTFTRQMEQLIESSIGDTTTRTDRQTIAERLLEPDFQKYTDLVRHSREVAVTAQRFAEVLDLPVAQIETIRMAALLHDVGMRFLDYDRLYRRPHLTPEELRGVAEHPLIGAAIVEPLLGPEVAQAILRHHERFDGRGYPSRLSGQQIPLASRVIQICDAWTTMTSRNSYKPPIQREQAVARLREGAGTQFDDALVQRFLAALGTLTAT